MSVLHLSLLLGVLGAGAALAQDDPTHNINDAARAEMEQRQAGQTGGGGSPGLSPNMGIEPYVPGTQRYVPGTQEINDSNHTERRRREETFRNPRPPRYDDDDDYDRRPKKYRPPKVIVRPYYAPPIYVQPPTIIVRPPYVAPYVPPPVYAQPYIPPRWSGPVHADVIWDLFPASIAGALPWRAREEHERAFIAALNSSVGVTLRWREAGARGEITVIDESYFGGAFCRDVVQTIRTSWTTRTVDGRVCIRPGQAWRLVAY